LLLGSLPALAQILSQPTLQPRANPRPSSQLPQWINYADCVANARLDFNITQSAAGSLLEVWAGTGNCTPLGEPLAHPASCRRIYSDTPNTTNVQVTVTAQELAAQGPAGPGGLDACNSDRPKQEVILTFMLKQGDAAISSMQFTGLGVDVDPPAAPTKLEVVSGETRLRLDWKGSSAADIAGYNFYCDPPPGALAGDAGVGTATAAQVIDAGVDAAAAGGAPGGTGGSPSAMGGAGGTSGAGGSGGTPITPAANCTGRSLLQEGARPNPALKCGSEGNSTSGIARGLVNGHPYGVAVAAVDTVGNVGVLSEVECGTPVQITDFYEYYRGLDGTGGGGFCAVSLGRTRSPALGAAFSALALAALLLARRARQERRGA
jgi:hypothetical protein